MNIWGKRYGVVLADPPWSFRVWSDRGKGRSAERHYPIMSIGEIKELPVEHIADDDCVLFLWATFPNLRDALEVMAAWGFEYKTVAFTWAKLNKQGGFFMGMGYWTRANAEICLLGTKGHPRRLCKGIPQLIVSQRREHSRKPDEQYERIEALVSGPYLELFARYRRDGWDSWGNEIKKEENKE